MNRRNFIAETLEPRRLLANVWVLNESNSMAVLDTEDADFARIVEISGIAAGEEMRSIDFRPATGQLFGITQNGQLYDIHPDTGFSTPVGTGVGVTLSGDRIDIDFNPVVDLIRLTDSTGLNARVSPMTGAAVDADPDADGLQLDGNLTYSSGDVSAGLDPFIVATAYTNNFNSASTSTLFGIDSRTNTVVQIGSPLGQPISPNTGETFTVGELGLNVISRAALDSIEVDGSSALLALLQENGSTEVGLYTISLQTGQATLVSPLGLKFAIDHTVQPPTTSGVVLIGGTEIARFDGFRVNDLYDRFPLQGLQAGERMTSVDFRPADRELYGFSDQGRVYVIDIENGQATAAGDPIQNQTFPDRIDIDFNPVVDLIRYSADTGQNWRVNPDSGALVEVDGNFAYAAGQDDDGDPTIVAGAYVSNLPDATSTTLFAIDAGNNALVTVGGNGVSPNTGTLFSVGPIGIDLDQDADAGFDIYTTGGRERAFALLNPAGTTGPALYGVNLATGAVSRGSPFGEGVIDFAFDPNSPASTTV